MRLSPRTQLTASLILAGVGLVLFFGNAYRVWFRAADVPYDVIGTAAFIAAVWFFVDAVHRVPTDDAMASIAPGEWQSWIGLAFCSALLWSLWIAAPHFAEHLPIQHNPDASRSGRSVGGLIVAWAVLGYVLAQRWSIAADERDHQIEQLSGQWGRAATTFAIVGVAVLLSFSPTERLQTLSYPWIGQLLIVALVFGAWVDHAAAAVLYWRDRRAAEAT